MKQKSSLTNLFTTVNFSLLTIATTHAGQTWDGGSTGPGDNNILTASNWDGATVNPDGTGDLALFNTGINFGGNTRNAIYNNRALASSFAQINFTNNGTAGRTNAFTLSGNSITLANNIQTTAVTTGPAITDIIDLDIILNTTATIAPNTNHNLTINGDISQSGTRGITKSSNGILTLTGNNTYTGTTTIVQGTLQISSIADFGTASNIGQAGSGHIIMGSNNNTGTLLYTGAAQESNRTIQISSSTNANTGGATIINNGTGALTFDATTFNNALANVNITTRALTLGGTNGGSITGIIQNNSATSLVSIVKNGTGTWTLAGGNSYTGATSVNAGILTFANKAARSTSAVSAIAAGTVGLGVKASDAAYYSATDVGNLFNTNTLTGFSLDAASGVAIDTTNAGGSFDQTVALTASRALTKLGTGTLILSQANTYSGATTVLAGTLNVTGSLANSAITVGADGSIGGTGILGAGLTIQAGGGLDLTSAILVANVSSLNILTITGGGLTLNDFAFTDITGWDYSAAAVGTYELIAGDFTVFFGGATPDSIAEAVDLGGGKKGYFTSGSLNAVIFAIPEPSSTALLGLGGLALILRRRR